MNKLIIVAVSILFTLLGLLQSCTYFSREKKVDKSYLNGYDYRLFQDTPAWELAKAVEDEDVSKINEIVAKNPEIINFQEPVIGKTLLMMTITRQQMTSFKTLLKLGADVNIRDTYDGSSAIIYACSIYDCGWNRDIAFVKMLVKYGADVNDVEVGVRRRWNSTRNTPLIVASESGDLEVVKFLIDNGADVNYQDECNRSALSQSIILDEYEVAYYLLLHGADYKRPVLYRPDYSIPSEYWNPNDKGEPIYLANFLREHYFDFYTKEYKYKLKIVAFLKNRGIDYKSVPVPDRIKKTLQKRYPDNWQEYLDKY